MLERYAMKVARTVLRGGSGSNVTPLPDQWTGGYAARFGVFFVALGFSRFVGESRPAHERVLITAVVKCRERSTFSRAFSMTPDRKQNLPIEIQLSRQIFSFFRMIFFIFREGFATPANLCSCFGVVHALFSFSSNLIQAKPSSFMRASTSSLGASLLGTFLRTKRVMSFSTPNFISAYLANCL